VQIPEQCDSYVQPGQSPLNGCDSRCQCSACTSFCNCDTVPDSVCDKGGFRVTFLEYIPASAGTSGLASYSYKVCVEKGYCRPTKSCTSNAECTAAGVDDTCCNDQGQKRSLHGWNVGTCDSNAVRRRGRGG
jgi:hypothetical protein